MLVEYKEMHAEIINAFKMIIFLTYRLRELDW